MDQELKFGDKIVKIKNVGSVFLATSYHIDYRLIELEDEYPELGY